MYFNSEVVCPQQLYENAISTRLHFIINLERLLTSNKHLQQDNYARHHHWSSDGSWAGTVIDSELQRSYMSCFLHSSTAAVVYMTSPPRPSKIRWEQGSQNSRSDSLVLHYPDAGADGTNLVLNGSSDNPRLANSKSKEFEPVEKNKETIIMILLYCCLLQTYT